MNGAGKGKSGAPSTSVVPSKTILAVAVAERSLLFEPGPLTVVMVARVPFQRASRETACTPPRLSRTFANVPLTLTVLRAGSNCVGAFAADATVGATSTARVASRETTYVFGREGRWADRIRGKCRPSMSDLALDGAG